MSDTISTSAAPEAQQVQDSADTTLEDLITLNRERAATYGFLSRLYRQEVTPELLDELHGLHYRVSTGNADIDEGHRLLATYLSGLWENSITELAADYMRVFFGHGYDGHAAAYPFESVYSSERRLLMQDARDEVLALYRAAGLGKQDSWKEGEDHIALELEYLQVLCQRTVEALERDDQDGAYNLVKKQANFMEDHIGGWAPMLTEQMKHFAKTDFYRALAYLTDGFLANDTEVMQDLLEGGED